jgi:hypothetical protein
MAKLKCLRMAKGKVPGISLFLQIEHFLEARDETRTRDPFLTMEVLYQLSYPGRPAP